MPRAALQPDTECEDRPKLREALAQLKAARMRITRPRVALLNVMLGNPAPRSFEEIHADVRGVCDPVTAYRSMYSFERAGLVRRLFRPPATQLLQISIEPEQYHVIDRVTGVAAPVPGVPSPELRLLVQQIEDKLRAAGYRDVSHVIQFFAGPPSTRYTP